MKVLTHEHARLIQQAILAAQANGDLPPFDIPDISIAPPKQAEHGDYASPIALSLAKAIGKKPLDIAQIIVRYLPKADFVGEVIIVAPGFINFHLNKVWLKAQVEAIIVEGDAIFTLDIGRGKRAQVEFVSANPTGPLHIGRSRGAMVGDTIARILEAAGYAVEREYYFNNAGVQMVNLGNSLRLRYLEALGRPVQLPEQDDTNFYRGEYLIEFAKELIAERGDSLADETDWRPFKEFAEQKMFNMIRATLRRVNINHDVFFNENSLYEDGAVWQTLAALEKAGYIYESVGYTDEEDEITNSAPRATAKWFRSTAFGDDKDRVMVKSDGNPTYTLPDIAYHINKIKRGFDLMVNILGADHYIQHQVVRRGLQALGYDPSGVRVVIIQFVRIVRQDPNTGKLIEVKMSTRRGNYETLDDLIDMTSPDAVRYHLLARNPNSHLDFNLDEVIRQSNENPVYYIQNAHVRCAGIFREAAARQFSDEGADVQQLGEEEMRFLRKALELGEIIAISATELAPHKIAFYAKELAAVFHPIYENARVLHSDVPVELAKARLRFYRAAQIVFKRVLGLMGMTAPERM